MKSFLDRTMIVVGILLIAWGYIAWFTRHESTEPRAILSFIYLIPGWALTTMGYVGWRTAAPEGLKQYSPNREGT